MLNLLPRSDNASVPDLQVLIEAYLQTVTRSIQFPGDPANYELPAPARAALAEAMQDIICEDPPAMDIYWDLTEAPLCSTEILGSSRQRAQDVADEQMVNIFFEVVTNYDVGPEIAADNFLDRMISRANTLLNSTEPFFSECELGDPVFETSVSYAIVARTPELAVSAAAAVRDEESFTAAVQRNSASPIAVSAQVCANCGAIAPPAAIGADLGAPTFENWSWVQLIVGAIVSILLVAPWLKYGRKQWVGDCRKKGKREKRTTGMNNPLADGADGNMSNPMFNAGSSDEDEDGITSNPMYIQAEDDDDDKVGKLEIEKAED